MAKKKEFDKLTEAEQRVVIAEDLIARLDAKTFIATKGTYWRANVRTPRNRETQLRDVYKGKVCRGCQIGGMFACALDRHNALKLSDLGTYSSPACLSDARMREYLTQWFSEKDISAMERAFEAWEPDSGTDQTDFRPFGQAFPLSKDRMRLIAENVIKNKGQFMPAQLLKLAAANI